MQPVQRQESYSTKASDVYLTQRPARRTATWKSQASEAHARTFAEYTAEAVPEPSNTNNWRVYAISVLTCMGAAAYGYDTGFFGGTLALPSFMRAFGITKGSKSQTSANLVSLFQGGSFFGAGATALVVEPLGRKWTIIISNIIFIASAFAQTFANGSVGVFMFGRFLGGFAVGILSLVIPVYLSEFAPPSIRGRLVGFFDIFIQVGTLCGFWINYGIEQSLPSNKFQWQLPVFVQFFPAAILLVGAFFIPETPRWLLSKGREEQARKSLAYLRKLPSDHEYLEYELSQTKAQVEADKLIRGDAPQWKLAKELWTSPGHRKRVLLGFGLIGFKTFSGVQAVNYYSPRIFEQLGFSGTKNSLFATGIYGTCKFVCTLIFGFFLVDRWGRRRPLMFGSLFLSLCLFYIGGYLTAVGPRDGTSAKTAGDYTAIVAIFLYASGYCFGWNSVPLTLISEIFTLRYRTLSMTFCLMWQWLCTFAIVRIMPVALNTIVSKTYFVFGSIFFCAGPFVYFLIPETKGLPLEKMDDLFGVAERSDIEKAIEEGKPELQHIEAIPRVNATALATVKE